MRFHRSIMFALLLALIVGTLGVLPAAATGKSSDIAFAPIFTYNTGLGTASAETVATQGNLLFVTNSANNSLDIVDITNPGARKRVDLAPFGAGPNSVAVRAGLVAVAVEASPKTNPGKVIFFDVTGKFLNAVTVGALPDMLTFSPNGRWLLVANEGEPNSYNQPDSVDPEGSVSVINVRGRIERLSQRDVKTARFTKDVEIKGQDDDDKGKDKRHPGLRVFGPNASLAQDLEPEYITVDGESKTAYVTLQEANAIAILDISDAEFEEIIPLGSKDHSLAGNALDASDRDGGGNNGRINIQNWPIFGLYTPDAIASFKAGDETYLITANEGDSRDYPPGFSEEIRVGAAGYVLDPTAFPNAAALKANAALGRLTVTNQNGDTDGDGDFDKIYTFGARSFTIWNDEGKQVFDSGDQLEQITSAVLPAAFNSDGPTSPSSFDTRSDNKGPEPEGVAVGKVEGRTLAFVGLERIGGVMIYDVSNPKAPSFVQYANNADYFAGTGDRGPEVVVFVPAERSPSGKARFLVANEISGTITIYEVGAVGEAGTLTLLHNNDGESALLPLTNSVGVNSGFPNTAPVSLNVGSAAAFKTVMDNNIQQARGARNSVLSVYAGDAFLASAVIACSLPATATTPVFDAIAQAQMAYDAHIFGNHEFDYSPDFLKRFIEGFRQNGRLDQPFLSGNLDFSGEPGFAELLDADGLIVGDVTDGRVVAKAKIATDKTTGQRFGIVSATTPTLPTISSPRNVTVTPDLASTAALVQQQIDMLQSQYGLKKIIFVSHLQSVANDRELLALMRGIDIAVAGGGDDLLNSPAIPDNVEFLPGDTPLSATTNPYPSPVTDAAGRTVYLVTTAGNYKYVGRVDATFDVNGEVSSINAQTSYSRRVIPSTQTSSTALSSLGLTAAATVASNPGINTTVITPVNECLTTFRNTVVAGTEVQLNVARGSATVPGVRTVETNGGNLIADGFFYSYNQLAVRNGLLPASPTNRVIALTNGGGIRQNAGDVLPVGGVVPGTISRLDTLNVLPFDNFLTVVQNVTPADLKTILERSASAIPGGGGQFLQISGFKVVYDARNPVGSRVISATFSDGAPIITNGAPDPAAPASFAVVTNSFTAAGGDNYPTLANNPNKRNLLGLDDTLVSYEQAWLSYLQSLPAVGGVPTISAADPRYAPGGEGRITIIR